MKFRPVTGLILLASIALFAAACADDGSGATANAIVTDIPWTAPESYRYVLVDSSQVEQGTGTLSVVRDGDNLALVQAFSDEEGNSDMSVLLVDPLTLTPERGMRLIGDAKGDRRVRLDTQYGAVSDNDDYGVRIRERNFKPASREEPSSQRCNPKRLPRGAYDNDASLFLWRTIEFEEGNRVVYTASIANRREQRSVALTVRRQERVETPAGQFDAWFVTIEAEGQSHEAWFATTDDHKLLVYDNDNVVFLYAGEADEPPRYEDPPGVDIVRDCK